MNCEQFETRLQQLMDERADLDAFELRNHESECSQCRGLRRSYQELLSALPALRKRSLVESVKESRTWQRRDNVARWAAVAVAVLIVIVPMASALWQNSHSQEVVLANDSTARTEQLFEDELENPADQTIVPVLLASDQVVVDEVPNAKSVSVLDLPDALASVASGFTSNSIPGVSMFEKSLDRATQVVSENLARPESEMMMVPSIPLNLQELLDTCSQLVPRISA
jgi:hypothetical protein